LRRDPPPDLAIEVDVTSSSLDRMAIYAALRVPELWRLEGDVLQFFVLQANGKYKETDRSKAFPQVTPADLMRFVVRARRSGDQHRVLRDFRKWVRSWKLIPPFGRPPFFPLPCRSRWHFVGEPLLPLLCCNAVGSGGPEGVQEPPQFAFESKANFVAAL